MPTVIDEGFLRFEFGEGWSVIKYDDHADYTEKIGRLQGTKAVDFAAVDGGGRLFLIEVKDFRGHRAENRERIRDGELAVEVAQKVRDTIAGVVAAHHRGNTGIWEKSVRCLINADPPVRVLLWLEDDLPPAPRGRRMNQASVVTDALKRQLRWLTPKILVMNVAIGAPEGITVSNLSGAGHST